MKFTHTGTYLVGIYSIAIAGLISVVTLGCNDSSKPVRTYTHSSTGMVVEVLEVVTLKHVCIDGYKNYTWVTSHGYYSYSPVLIQNGVQNISLVKCDA
jgi:hypothetical protein